MHFSLSLLLSYFSCHFLDIAQSKFLLPVLRKVICFYPLGAFPRRLHSSISVRLVVASRNSVLFPPSSKEFPFLLLVPYSRLGHSIAQECIAHAPSFFRGFIFSIRLWWTHIHPLILISRIIGPICELEVGFGAT